MSESFSEIVENLQYLAPPTAEDLELSRQVIRRESFRQANASAELEGLVATAEEIALQEEVITGMLSTEQAIDRINAKFGLKK